MLLLVAFVLAMIFKPHTSDDAKSASDRPLTNEEKTRIAAEVVEGKRPRTDLDKYGIAIGQRQQIDPKTFLEMAERERTATRPSRPASLPAGPENSN
ncbi:MAG TPA: hypothetical protein VK797_26275 [Tepidisphaeraceae bacterium]|nr:hypothetical protein [Tepidisphaeraceae bacterium]